MESGGFFVQAFVYLAAALLVVPVARRLGLGSVLGYLASGIAIGPHGLGLVGQEGQGVLHFAEFGVVMMLFLVGLELEPARLWRLRGPVLGLGGAQVLVTAALVAVAALPVGLPWQQGLALGLILAMSSTAIALQSLTEQGRLKTDAGQKAFAVLLFQDIAVIPMLAGLPLLATLAVATGAGHATGPAWLADLGPWLHALVVLAAILAVIAAGRWLVRPAMRIVARTGLREMFTAAALLLVVGVTLLMGAVGLSPALGTFLAGVVLASSEYRHELESDIEPFKGLLLGLFFLSVGASIDFALVAAAPGQTAAWVAAVTVAKLAILLALARLAGARTPDALVFAFSLAQVGEFAFVLLGFARQSGVLPATLAERMVAVTALSMGLSPLLLAANERWLLPRWTSAQGAGRAHDTIDEHSKVIIAGYGRFGQVASRLLRAQGIATTLLDHDSDQIEVVKRFGQKVFYGDAARLDLLRAAGAEQARLLVLAMDDHAKVLEAVHLAHKHFPHLQIFARARGRQEAYELLDLGVQHVYRETFDTALRLGKDALTLLGAHPHRATRAARTFWRYDEATVRELAKVHRDDAALVASSRERVALLTEALREDAARLGESGEDSWDFEPLTVRGGDKGG